ncbi:MAG: DUF305 domain-containing protein [Candidatus Eremiobacteraeota bacterium]|nr:DUF305 domain-containing protein [Candidatus Eremiobacteraeota bacterium]
MKSRIAITLTLTLGLAIGAGGERMAMQSSASAQTLHTNKATPMHDSHTMMKMSKSPAETEMMNAMMRMRQPMMSMTMTGNPDRDFMMMMIPHHRAAIDMAIVELKYGKDTKVRRLAKNIVAAQHNEITEMTQWLHR